MPWFPGARGFEHGKRAKVESAPRRRSPRCGFALRAPPTCPVCAWSRAGGRSARRWRQRLLVERKADVLVSPWAHPDSTAAVMLGRAFGLPVAIKLHGSTSTCDQVPASPQSALGAAADGCGAVGRPLAEAAIELGARRTHTTVLMDVEPGPDAYVRDRLEAARAGPAGLGKIALFVGNLLKGERRGRPGRRFRALAHTRHDLSLLIIGEGRSRSRSRSGRGRLARSCEFWDRIRTTRWHVIWARPIC